MGGTVGVGVAGTGVGVGVAGTGVGVAGTGVGVEPEQAATVTANIAKNRARYKIEARRRLNFLGRRIKMLTSFLRMAVHRWIYPLGPPTGGWLKPSISLAFNS